MFALQLALLQYGTVYTIVQFFKYAIKILQNNLNSDFYTKYILKKQSGFGVTVFDMWKRAFFQDILLLSLHHSTALMI